MAGLTTRAAVLGLVLCALVVTLAIPLRELLAQHSQIAGLQADQSAAEQRVAELAQQKRLLEDPTYVAALARQRLHFVKPGETAYVVLAPEQPAALATAPATRVNADARSPWYSQLWGSVEEADKPVAQQ
ncbi:MAG: ftsL2 [Frankiales bacterium]|nr:ftsL2 [Frankiales bacterium]